MKKIIVLALVVLGLHFSSQAQDISRHALGLRLGDNNGFVNLAADVGIEYNFKETPVLLSLDYRPEFGGQGYFDNNYGSDIALGIKYKF